MGGRRNRGLSHQQLSRRERQIMDVVYRQGRTTVAEVRANLPDPPTQDASEAGHLLIELCLSQDSEESEQVLKVRPLADVER